MVEVLIIDDDVKLSALIVRLLNESGMAVRTAATPSAGLAELRAKTPDLVILDVNLPEQSGFAVCETIRAISTVPVIMLTSHGEVEDRVKGLAAGADDYLPKPFDGRELLARVQAALRRAAQPPRPAGQLKFGTLVIDPGARVCTVAGEAMRLSGAEFDVLCLLAQNVGRVLTREEIVANLTEDGSERTERSIDVAISRLRARLGDSAERPFRIKTIWGKGYTFLT